MHTHVRVYKTVDSERREDFEVTVSGGKATRGYLCHSIERLAYYVASEIAAKDNTGDTAIDFSPKHDIVHSKGGGPRRCFRLSEQEQSFFWYRFKRYLSRPSESTRSLCQ